MQWFRDQRGFSFLEISIVIAIIGVLMMIGLPNYKAAAEKAQRKVCEANQRLIEAEMENYYLEKSKYPVGEVDVILNELVVEDFLKDIPKCPIEEGRYRITTPSEGAKVTCDEHTETDGSLETDAPSIP